MSSSGLIGSTTFLPSFNQLVDQFKDAKADKNIR